MRGLVETSKQCLFGDAVQLEVFDKQVSPRTAPIGRMRAARLHAPACMDTPVLDIRISKSAEYCSIGFNLCRYCVDQLSLAVHAGTRRAKSQLHGQSLKRSPKLLDHQTCASRQTPPPH